MLCFWFFCSLRISFSILVLHMSPRLKTLRIMLCFVTVQKITHTGLTNVTHHKDSHYNDMLSYIFLLLCWRSYFYVILTVALFKLLGGMSLWRVSSCWVSCRLSFGLLVKTPCWKNWSKLFFFAKTRQKERKIKEIHFYQFRNSPFITLKLSGLGASCNTPWNKLNASYLDVRQP